ncbi:hypothetical protein CROQUDRAFT_54801 [Cronartium quercuum f. sp. fusiforme G11]|uniref:tRNA(His) guanylyltransferase n=1 Tax=Cronartium quercuum f. sp. fusiforme G11 TaxID=708437 RepID=A0A9P6T6G4_9BASI|nr:hypothetical protein CROQUDRAFT_54801 [Cronartium quercuum f. sp. fusiforme G11]
MANSRFGYVRGSELDDRLLPQTYVVIRLDGKGFTKFSSAHAFEKPNDKRALRLMNEAAKRVLESDLGRGKRGRKGNGGGILLAYGQSDEYSFAFSRRCDAYNRRASKLLTIVLSTFTAAYIHLWPVHFPESPLELANLPTFDGRIIQYTSDEELRDYFKWRQADAHINNLYNTTFWALIQLGHSTHAEAHAALKGSLSRDKHSILFDRFRINYNAEPEIFKKGSILLWSKADADIPSPSVNGEAKDFQPSQQEFVTIIHEDLIKDQWWESGAGFGLLA